MTGYQFNLILSLLFVIAANVANTPGATAIGYTIGTACALVALGYAFLERKS